MSQPGGRPLAPTGRFRVRGAPRPCREGNSASSVRKGDDLSRGCEIRRAHVCWGSNIPAIRLKSGKTVGSPAAAEGPGLGPGAGGTMRDSASRDSRAVPNPSSPKEPGALLCLGSDASFEASLLPDAHGARSAPGPGAGRPRRSLMNSCDRQPGVAVTWLSRAPHAGPASTPAAGAAIKCCLLPDDQTGGLRLSCRGRASATPQPADREHRDRAGR